MTENTEENVEATEGTEAPTAIAMKRKVEGVTREAVLTVLVKDNPKREGSKSYDRFEGYRTDPAPATVQAALDNGLTMGDIAYDVIHGSIEVEGAEVVEYTPAKRAPKDPDSASEVEDADDVPVVSEEDDEFEEVDA